MIVESKIVFVDDCTSGAFIRWYYNGWHIKMFSERYSTQEKSTVNGVQVVEKFSQISLVKKNTSRKSEVFITVGIDNIDNDTIEIYKGLLIAESVQIYQYNQWVSLEVDRGSFSIRPTKLNKYNLEFTAKLMQLLSTTHLVVPPTDEPITTWTWTESFDNWDGTLPYGRKPVGWTQLASPGATSYLVDSGTDAEFHSSLSTYYQGSNIRYDFLTNQGKVFSTSVSVEFKINSISSGALFSVAFYDSAGYACSSSYSTTSIGVKSNVFLLTANARFAFIYFMPVSGTGKTGVLDYIKFTQL